MHETNNLFKIRFPKMLSVDQFLGTWYYSSCFCNSSDFNFDTLDKKPNTKFLLVVFQQRLQELQVLIITRSTTKSLVDYTDHNPPFKLSLYYETSRVLRSSQLVIYCLQ